MITEYLHVVAGVIRNESGAVLISQRLPHVDQGGLWEFPGGKRESGEDAYQALVREIKEELNIKIINARPLIKITHQYPGQGVLLDVWQVEKWQGTPRGMEGQPVQWCDVQGLSILEFPAANDMILRALQLPALYLISPGPRDNPDQFIAAITQCLAAGARLLQLRCPADLYQRQPDLVRTLVDVCNDYQTRLLLNAAPATAALFKTHGVHLNSVRLLQLNERPLGNDFIVAASCHNRTELEHAARIGVDFVVLSPVLHTSSHPDARPLGWDKFSELTQLINIPVYALGGMNPHNIRTAWENGAQGIAMLGGVWTGPEPAAVIKACFSV